jgi:hypothetical protein
MGFSAVIPVNDVKHSIIVINAENRKGKARKFWKKLAKPFDDFDCDRSSKKFGSMVDFRVRERAESK